MIILRLFENHNQALGLFFIERNCNVSHLCSPKTDV